MKKLLPLLTAILLSATAFAQDFKYGDVTSQDLDMKKYDKDTSAHALVLDEHCSAKITISTLDEIRLEYNYHEKIKFFDDKEFERMGTIKIQV